MVAPESHLYFVVLVDIEDSSHRPDSVQSVLNQGVYDVVTSALKRAGVDFRDELTSDRGDGMLIMLPPTLSPPTLLRELVRGLDDALSGHRRAHNDAYRMRLRVGLQTGLVARDGNRWTGTTINELHQLVGSDEVRQALKGADHANMVFVVPDSLYTGVVEGHHPGIDPAAYVPFDFVTKHRVTRRGWLTLPGSPGTPGDPAADGRSGTPGTPRTPGGTGGAGMRFENNGTNHGTVVQGAHVHGNTFGR
ncbi:hypothetical protein ACIRRX_06655 [Streptomyces bacillaris]